MRQIAGDAGKALLSAMFGLLLVGAGVSKAEAVVDMFWALRFGISGQVVVTECTWDSSGRYRPGGWRCNGRFVASDGTVSDLPVTVHQKLDHRPGQPLPTMVSSATARYAYQPDMKDWLWEVALALGGVVGGAASCWLAWRTARRAATCRRRWHGGRTR